jgi:hypothetical protein
MLHIWDLVLFGLNLKDVDCGFKLIKKSVIDQVFPLVTESAITETELMAKIHRTGYPIKQIGVTHHSRADGEQTGGKFKVIFKAGIESLKLFWHFNRDNWPLWLVLALASFLRLYKIEPYLNFLGDEGRDALVWHHMLQGDFTLLGPTASVGGFYLGPIYYYLALPFYFLFRSPVGPAIFIALLGVATVYLVYWLVKHITSSKYSAYLSALIYAASPLVVRYSRFSWNPNPIPFFILLMIADCRRLFRRSLATSLSYSRPCPYYSSLRDYAGILPKTFQKPLFRFPGLADYFFSFFTIRTSSWFPQLSNHF